jgi:hypothetical protein
VTRSGVLETIGVTLAASAIGVAAGTVAATPPIALANFLATDGPYFEAPFVALALVAAPIGVLLLPVQLAALGYQVRTGRPPGTAMLVLGIATGLVVGVGWYLALAAPRPTGWMLWAVGGVGACQACAVFAAHWLAYRWRP